jgi:hypothetical protein
MCLQCSTFITVVKNVIWNPFCENQTTYLQFIFNINNVNSSVTVGTVYPPAINWLVWINEFGELLATLNVGS